MIPLIGVSLLLSGSVLLWFYFRPPRVDPYVSDEELVNILRRESKKGDTGDRLL